MQCVGTTFRNCGYIFIMACRIIIRNKTSEPSLVDYQGVRFLRGELIHREIVYNSDVSWQESCQLNIKENFYVPRDFLYRELQQ